VQFEQIFVSDALFPKIAPARSVDPYGVQTSDLFPRRIARKSLYVVRSNHQISDRIFRRSTNFLSTSAFPFAKSGSFAVLMEEARANGCIPVPAKIGDAGGSGFLASAKNAQKLALPRFIGFS
jgi:hypothetical protein